MVCAADISSMPSTPYALSRIWAFFNAVFSPVDTKFARSTALVEMRFDLTPGNFPGQNHHIMFAARRKISSLTQQGRGMDHDDAVKLALRGG